jgi:hypothetical protein
MRPRLAHPHGPHTVVLLTLVALCAPAGLAEATAGPLSSSSTRSVHCVLETWRATIEQAARDLQTYGVAAVWPQPQSSHHPIPSAVPRMNAPAGTSAATTRLLPATHVLPPPA